jgi:hypothetical protein
MLNYSYQDGSWVWGGPLGRNCVSDAEQLLTVIQPATSIPSLRVDRPDLQTAADVVEVLRALGSPFAIAEKLVDAMVEFHEHYLDDAGQPVYSGSTYLVSAESIVPAATPQQAELDLVDSMSMSITLALGALTIARSVRQATANHTVRTKCDRLENLASVRLTGAMAGLLRAFGVRTFAKNSGEAQRLAQLINQGSRSPHLVLAEFYGSLNELRSSLRKELSLGASAPIDDLEDPDTLFDCGWSWGLIDGADPIGLAPGIGERSGVAVNLPHLYFTVVALEGIQDLFSSRIRMLGLLDEHQQRLATALQLRWEWAGTYWSAVATWGSGRWPLEDLPWSTLENEESEYLTLLLATILLFGPARERRSGVIRERALAILEELANRGRITRRPLSHDSALRLHSPGLWIPLRGIDKHGGPLLGVILRSYSTMLLKRVLDLAQLTDTVEARSRSLGLADAIWDHLQQRRLETSLSGEGLWDQPQRIYAEVSDRFEVPSWYHTQRVVEALVMSTHVITGAPIPNPELQALAEGLLTEADHLLDQLRLSGLATTADMPRRLSGSIAKIDRARALILEQRPAAAHVHVADALRELDEVAAASEPNV